MQNNNASQFLCFFTHGLSTQQLNYSMNRYFPPSEDQIWLKSAETHHFIHFVLNCEHVWSHKRILQSSSSWKMISSSDSSTYPSRHTLCNVNARVVASTEGFDFCFNWIWPPFSHSAVHFYRLSASCLFTQLSSEGSFDFTLFRAGSSSQANKSAE